MTISAIPFPEDFYPVLQDCLERLGDEEQTIDSVLLSYPRFRDRLRAPLEAAAWLYSKKIMLNPRPEFIPTSRIHLVGCLLFGERNPIETRKIRGRRTRLVIWKNAVFFSLLGPFLASLLEH